MHPKLRRAINLSFWAFVYWFIMLSLVTKTGCNKYGPSQPLSWEEWFGQLYMVAALGLIISLVLGLGSLLEKLEPQEEFICPRCGIDQPDRENDFLSDTRRCIACKEVSPKTEWKSLGIKSE